MNPVLRPSPHHLRPARYASALLLALVAAAAQPAAAQPAAAPALDTLAEGQVVAGFETRALYLNDRGEAMGGRFAHQRTGFVLDLLQIESVPQAFIWVQTIPDSDRGEPHTQEHLLLGKGNHGRAVASLETMYLAESSAFTQRTRTAYHLHATVGWEPFLAVLEARLASLLHPDYSDEEIRREVHNYSVTTDAESGALALEEGGTVYNEMVSSYGRADYRLWRATTSVLYGPEHPLARESGGLPEGIREMTPEHIRDFHARHYRLDNMGVIGAFDASLPYDARLLALGAMLDRVAPELPATAPDVIDLDELPPPAPAASRAPQAIPYPHGEDQDAVEIELLWPPSRALPLDERLLLELFLATFAGEAGTNLHRVFVDSETVEIDLGTTSVGAGFLDWPGLPVYVTLSGAASARLDAASIERARARVVEELRALAEAAPDDPRVVDFQRRMRSQLVASQRRLRDQIDSPPGFGIRGTYATWIEHLEALEQAAHDAGGTFRRPLTLRDAADSVAALLDAPGNPWTERIPAWGLLEEPYVIYGQPSTALAAQLDAERTQRLASRVAALAEEYGLDDPQAAIARFRDDYDARTAELDAVAAQVTVPPFVDAPPMTLDDPLRWEVTTLAGAPLVTSTFANMSGATVGIAIDLRGVTEADLLLLALLPDLLRRTGIASESEQIPYVEMVERLQNEILDLDVSIASDLVTGRVELALSASGTSPEEAALALAWLERALFAADWRTENLPRLRDVVDEALDGLRRMTQQGEEYWVNDPVNAFRYQTRPVFLATSSFLTRTHAALRLRWLLREPDPAALTALEQALTGIAEVALEGTFDRASLEALFARGEGTEDPTYLVLHPPSDAGRAVVREALEDITLTLGDLPDDSFHADLAYLARQILADYRAQPADTLAALSDLRSRLLRRSGARLWQVGATPTLDSLAPRLTALVERLGAASAEPMPDSAPLVTDRLRARTGSDSAPVFVGLVNPDTRGGVHLHSAPTADYLNFDEDGLLDFLTGRMYGGGGAHSLFMRTWGAGLAYSNGVRADAQRGTLRYYAERCPELPQTMRFVIGELSAVTSDPGLAEYALSQVFESRAARGYAARGAALAADLADGRTPERVRAFREAVLALRDREGLSAELFGRMQSVYGRILPGWGPPSAEVAGGVYYVIGPDAQLDAWEAYLRAEEGADARLWRVYGRDYWMPGPEAP
jgi:hypothetical protein